MILVDDLIVSDVPCLKQMVEAHAETRGNIVAVEEVPREHTNRYGVLDPAGDDGRLVGVRGLVEKPDPAKAPSRLAVIGRYILLPEVFEHLDRHADRCRRRDPADRCHGPDDRPTAFPRPALCGATLRLRRRERAISKRSSPARLRAR